MWYFLLLHSFHKKKFVSRNLLVQTSAKIEAISGIQEINMYLNQCSKTANCIKQKHICKCYLKQNVLSLWRTLISNGSCHKLNEIFGLPSNFAREKDIMQILASKPLLDLTPRCSARATKNISCIQAVMKQYRVHPQKIRT